MAKYSVATAKSTHYNHVYKELDTPGGVNKIYCLVNTCNHSMQDIGQVSYIKDTNHQVLHNPPAILKCWSKHFSAICNEQFPHPAIQSADPAPGPVLPIAIMEVKAAMRKMKNGKVTRPDDIPAEVWKLLG